MIYLKSTVMIAFIFSYSKKARIISFGYLAQRFVFLAFLPSTPNKNIIDSTHLEQVKGQTTVSVPTPADIEKKPLVSSEAQPVAKEIPKAEQVKVGQTGLKITPDEFYKNYNKEAENLNLWKITKTEYMKDGKTVNFKLHDGFFIIGQIDANKNLDKVVLGLTLFAKNRDKIQDQDLQLLDIGQSTLVALDNNNDDLKVGTHREATLNVVHGDLLQDGESLKGANVKTAVDEHIIISVAIIPEMPALTIRFEPRP
ncbi:hypothetical protein [Acinetobacter boissieri]|uniref:Uncharacterized protein n=1 Tax=Acinetobacter boissieri TaxID=1219383 RepID=A0A1G6KF17_9GAMM|nr:hypothetical protein [Acinetobacter boissieri]SDC29553.1 hypothetical protein SAMN05421733_11716 [Acinetobacter boissieri]